MFFGVIAVDAVGATTVLGFLAFNTFLLLVTVGGGGGVGLGITHSAN